MSNIKQIRMSLGISQDALAAEIGVTQGAIAHFEAGKRTPNINMCWKIVKALNQLGAKCTFDDVFPDPQEDCGTEGQEVKPPIKGANGE
ncbi:helix-turn-helix transcriptional regulator [Vibrio campbellii]|uniref:Helix-turn-helix transcriptional regulator n=1 Tax=Vibrio campbellii TaxID=680 RepID=A0AAE9SNJ0_9VIBR|nr:helix-turn-helix transcriptional regulator [Vibrio campbellii]UTZ27713.1 helix-turn-helix transcriptional regulator [Vibrio campbellii]